MPDPIIIDDPSEDISRFVTRIDGYLSDYDDGECSIADLLCDIMHWCDANNVYFDDEIFQAKTYYLNDLHPGETS